MNRPLISRTPNVDFITFVHWRDYKRLAVRGELKRRVASHGYPFSQVIVIRQRLRDVPEAEKIHYPDADMEVETEDYPNILADFGIPEEDAIADEKTHGPDAPHYWKWHCINHLIGLQVSTADYIVFSDSDCRIQSQPISRSWVHEAIDLLRKYNEILIVSPSDGGGMAERRLPRGVRLTQNVSQQIFLCHRETLRHIDFNIPWNWEFIAPGGPFQEYYYMLEGRMWRYMHYNGKYRALLPKAWRYWHDQW